VPVELIAAWLVMQAYKLIVVPVATGVRQRLVDDLSAKIAAPVSAKLFGDHVPAPEDGGGLASEPDSDAEVKAEREFVDTIEEAPEARAVMGEEMERFLGVKLGVGGDQGSTFAGARRGSDGWYVSAYASILWRIAMLAVWEERPIAIQGALQGREWLTVCVPRVRGAINPSAMWQHADSRTLLRIRRDGGPADFFVRQIGDEGGRRHEVAALNEQFMIDPTAVFKPTEVEFTADNWHRIDGVYRKWVLLKPDAVAEEAIARQRPHRPAIYGGRDVRVDLEYYPPKFNEYPADWQPLLKIGSEEGGIAALSAGADEFARASEASAAAVEALFESWAH
jgi:hypothetical protein